MIIFDRVSKSFPLRRGGRVSVIEDFSGTIEPGRNIGILGRNGAGKSTLMRLIAGSEVPTSGEIYKDGNVSWPLGFAGGFSSVMTGRQNLRFIADIYDDDYARIVDFVEDFAEIGHFMDEPVGTYSSGMRARLAFGASMALEFDYYLIDEVIGVGDRAFREKCSQILADRADRATVLLVSHSVRLLRDFCDIGGVLEDRRITFYSTLDEAIGRYEAQ